MLHYCLCVERIYRRSLFSFQILSWRHFKRPVKFFLIQDKNLCWFRVQISAHVFLYSIKPNFLMFNKLKNIYNNNVTTVLSSYFNNKAFSKVHDYTSSIYHYVVIVDRFHMEINERVHSKIHTKYIQVFFCKY